MFAIIMVLILAIACSILFERKIYETLPVAVFAAALSVYILALLLPLNVAVWICMAVFLTAAVIVCIMFRKRVPPLATGLAPVACLLCVCALFSLLLAGHRVYFYDDLSYWGIYTKNIFTINRLPHLFENCSVDYKDYTPIMQILQYLAMFGRREFTEGVMYQTNVCFIYIMLLPLLSSAGTIIRTKGEKITPTGLMPVIIYLLFPHILTAQFYYRLGVDLFLALVFGYILYYIFLYDASDRQGEIFRITAVTTALAFLALIKSSGIVLCLISVIMFIIREVVRNREEKKPKQIIYGKAVIITLFVLGSYFSWQLFLRYSGNNGYLSNRVKDSVGGGSFSLPSYTGEVILNYIKHFILYPLTRNAIGITAAGLVIFIILVHVICRKTAIGKAMFICSVTGLVIFCIAHICMYLFVFDEWEAHGLMEYDRYITQYLGGIFFLYVCKLLSEVSPNGEKAAGTLLCIATVVFIILLPYADMRQYLIPSNYNADYARSYAGTIRDAEREWEESGIDSLGLVHDGTQKLTVVANAWDEKTQFIEYVAVPQPINRIVNVPAVEPGAVNGYIMDFVDEYVYVCENAADSYTGDWNETAEVTTDGSPLLPGRLYQTVRIADEKRLEPIP